MKPKRNQQQPSYPPYYVLPRDVQTVKIVAYAQVLENAHLHLKEERLFNADAIHAMAIEACLLHEQVLIEGKQGTNNPGLFRKTFIDTFREHYPRVLEEMRQSEHMDLIDGKSEQERGQLFLEFATAHYASMN